MKLITIPIQARLGIWPPHADAATLRYADNSPMRLCLLLGIVSGILIGQGQNRFPLGEIPPGKILLVAQPHHDDHTTDYGMGGVIARFVEHGYKAYYIRASNDEKDGANGYPRNDIINLKETWNGIRILGMEDVISLNWRNDFMNPIPLNELREQLIFLIRKYRPDVVRSASLDP